MKQIIYTLSGAMLCAVLFAALLSVDARAVRENEIRTALSDAVEEAVEEAHLADINHRLTNDELIALFEQLLLSRLNVNGDADGSGDPNFAVTVDIAGADAKKGLLFVHIKETFTYPNGNTGTIEDTARLLVEQEDMRGMRTVTYMHTDAAVAQSERDGNRLHKVVKVYHIEDGRDIPAPAGEWVLAEEADNGNRIYIPRDEALHTDGIKLSVISDTAVSHSAGSSPADAGQRENAPDATGEHDSHYPSPMLHRPDEKPENTVSGPLPELINELNASDSHTDTDAKDGSGPDAAGASQNAINAENRGILVAVIDTGIDLSLQSDPSSPLYGRISDAVDPAITDMDGHGSAMASIIAQHTPESVKLLPIKAFDGNGSGSIEAACAAMEQALALGASVINLSFSGSGTSERMAELIRRAGEQGCAVIAASGNEGADVSGYVPANIEAAITVAAVEEDGSHPAYSNYGAAIDFAADGLARLSGMPGDEAGGVTYSGTSVAAAHASAYAALLLAAAPDGDIDIYASFLASAEDYGEPGRDIYFGNGYLSAGNLVRIARDYFDSGAIPVAYPSPEIVPVAHAGSDIVLSRAAYPAKTMTYSTTEPIELRSFGAGAHIRVAWDNSSGYNRNGGVTVSCSGTVTPGANYIDAVSADGNFKIALHNFNFSRNGNYNMSHAIIISVTPGTRRGFVYNYAQQHKITTAAYSFTTSPVNGDYLYEPDGGYNGMQATAGSLILVSQPYAYWTSGPEQTVIPARPNDASGCTIFVAPSKEGRYYTTYYGGWTAKVTNVNYHGNGGTVTGDPRRQIEDGYYDYYDFSYLVNNRYFNRTATRPGYLFDGWNTRPDGSGSNFPVGFDLEEYTAAHPELRVTIDIYAQWRIATYTVHFSGTPTSVRKNNINGNPYSTEPWGYMADQVMVFDTSTALHANTFTRSGYRFLGWSTSPGANAVSYSDGSSAYNIISPTSGLYEVTLYALWQPVTYQIRYHANGVNGGTAPLQSATYDRAFWLYDNRFYETVNGRRSSSFIFNSYHTAPDASGGPTYGIRSEVRTADSPLSDTPRNTWVSGQKVYNLTADSGRTIDIYAIWDVDFTLSLSADIRSGETNRSDLYDMRAFPYRTPACSTVVYEHLGTKAGNSAGAANPYLRDAFCLPDGYPFIKEKKVTAQSGEYYDVNAAASADYVYRYSQQGWTWYASDTNHPQTGKPVTYREPDYIRGDYLTADPAQRRRTDGITQQYVKWLLYAIEKHPSNVTADGSGYLTVTLYALWDEAPVIDAYDRYFTTGELEKYLSNGTLPAVLFEADVLRVRDREDALLSDGTVGGIIHKDGTPAITTELDTAELLRMLADGGERFGVSFTITAKDAVGNVTMRTVLIHVTSDTPIRSESDRNAYAASFVRAISRKNYARHTGTGEAADIRANEEGALKAHSLWYENADYKKVITDALSVLEANGGYIYSKTFDRQAIRDIQDYVKEKGTGFTKADPGRLKRWMDIFY